MFLCSFSLCVYIDVLHGDTEIKCLFVVESKYFKINACNFIFKIQEIVVTGECIPTT